MAGDVRFLSHHDFMRLLARAAARASLPLAYTQGFNPHPKLSVPLPRPVGVAARSELLVLALAEDADAPAVLALGGQLPPGVRLLRVEALASGAAPRVRSARYELALRPAELPAARRRLEALEALQRWEVNRSRKRPGRSGGGVRVLDVKGRVRALRLDGDVLSFTLAYTPDGSVRCAEMLALLGLTGPIGTEGASARDASEAAARLVRTEIQCES